MSNITTALTGMPSEVLAQIYSSLGSRQDVDSFSRTCRDLAIWELYRHTIPGFPVSKEAAQETFSALGDDSWKIPIEEKFHGDGRWVFDQGLHYGDIEPGFYNSALNGLDFAKEHIGEALTVELYCKLHKIVCAHFEGAANATLMKASEAGSLRSSADSGTKFDANLDEALAFFDRKNRKEEAGRNLRKEYLQARLLHLMLNEANASDPIDFTNKAEHFNAFETLLQGKMQETSEQLQDLKRDARLSQALPTISLKEQIIRVDYATPGSDTFSFETVIPYVFSEFNRSIAAIDKELLGNGPHDRKRDTELTHQKLELIYGLYQKLEWFHAFRDGQGRTDVITLAKLLSENGFNPAILNNPYVSSFAPLADCIDDLKGGMAKWRQAAESIRG